MEKESVQNNLHCLNLTTLLSCLLKCLLEYVYIQQAHSYSYAERNRTLLKVALNKFIPFRKVPYRRYTVISFESQISVKNVQIHDQRRCEMFKLHFVMQQQCSFRSMWLLFFIPLALTLNMRFKSNNLVYISHDLRFN